MSKRFTVIAGSLALALLAVSCGNSDDPNTNSASEACPLSALDEVTTPVEVTVWHNLASLNKKVLEQQIAAFNASQNKVRVVGQNQGITFDEVQRKVEQAIPDRQLPGIVLLEDTKTQWAADSHLFVSGTECLAQDPEAKKTFDNLLPIVKKSYELNNTFLPVSFSTYTAVVFFNQRHFSAAGLDQQHGPATLDEMYEQAKRLKATFPDKTPVAMVAQPWILEWWLSGAGQPLVNNNNGRAGRATESEFDNPNTKSVLKLFQKMKSEGLLNIVPATPGQTNHVLAMANQTASMVVESTAANATIAGVLEGTIDSARLKEELGIDLPAGSENLKLDLQIGASPLPGIKQAGKGQIGGGVWYIPNTGTPAQQAGAWRFAQFMNQTANQAQWSVTGSNVPVFTPVIADPSVTTSWTSSLAGKWQKIAYDVLAGVSSDFPGPIIGPYSETRIAEQKAIEEALINDRDVDEVVAQADSTITSELAAYAQDAGKGS